MGSSAYYMFPNTIPKGSVSPPGFEAFTCLVNVCEPTTPVEPLKICHQVKKKKEKKKLLQVMIYS